jgi:hypothetical protein
VTTEFPLSGTDGAMVVLVSPSGAATRMKQGTAYTVHDGAVFFLTPPPEGWTVAFETPKNVSPPGKIVCTVVYPDGTIREVEQDPWLLLAEAKKEREEMQKLLKEARHERETALSQIFAASNEAKETLKSRLLNYDARGEAAIAAAVRATEEGTATVVNKNLLEIRKKHKEVTTARAELEEMTKRAESAANTAGNAMVSIIEEEVSACLREAKTACLRVQTAEAEVRRMKDEAKAAAEQAAADTTKLLDRRVDMFVRESENIRVELARIVGDARALPAVDEAMTASEIGMENTGEEVSAIVEQVSTPRPDRGDIIRTRKQKEVGDLGTL